jgi:hypothetical protein
VENQHNIPSIEQWISHLESLISGPIAQLPFGADQETKLSYIESFQDEFGSRRKTDAPLLSRVLSVPISLNSDHPDLDTRLWRCVVNNEHDSLLGIKDKDGLVEPDAYAIEHRTLIELCALHALWHLAAEREDPELLKRVDMLIDWHTRELQPDNGINRPWGVHAFICRSVNATDESTRLDAMLHAQTLVSNCCVTLGKPDILSAIILYDSAQALRLALTKNS